MMKQNEAHVERFKLALSNEPTNWRNTVVNWDDELLLKVGSWFLDDVFTIGEVMGVTAGDTLTSLADYYTKNPGSATALGLKTLVDAGIFSEDDADYIAQEWSNNHLTHHRITDGLEEVETTSRKHAKSVRQSETSNVNVSEDIADGRNLELQLVNSSNSKHAEFLQILLKSPGLHVILGGAGSGKTHLLSELAAAVNEPLSIYSEPDFRSKGGWRDLIVDLYLNSIQIAADDYHSSDVIARCDTLLSSVINDARLNKKEIERIFLSRIRGVAAKLKDSENLSFYRMVDIVSEFHSEPPISTFQSKRVKAGKGQIICLDSMKDLVYSAGNLGRGGISMSGLTLLSNLSACMSALNVVVVTTINPLRDELLNELMDFLKGAVTGSWSLSNNKVTGFARIWNHKDSYYERNSYTIMLDNVVPSKQEVNASKSSHSIFAEQDFSSDGELPLFLTNNNME